MQVKQWKKINGSNWAFIRNTLLTLLTKIWDLKPHQPYHSYWLKAPNGDKSDNS